MSELKVIPKPTAEPNPSLVFETLNAFQRTGALKAAIELRLFSKLSKGAQSVERLATACDASERGIRILCDYLTVIGFLEKSGADYFLTPTSAAFLDENSPKYMGSVAKFVASAHVIETYHDVAGAVRKGGTLLPDGGSTKLNYEPWVEFAKSMEPMMFSAAQFIAELVAERYPTGPMRVLDIASSHGLFGLSIARKLPEAAIIAQDFEPVLDVTRQNAEAAGMSHRFSFLPGDVMSIDLGGNYDCILLTNFLHHFGEPACVSLLRRLRAIMNPGGTVISLEFVPNEDRISPATPATFALTMLVSTDDGDAYTFNDYQRMFDSAGFTRNELIEVPHAPSRLIVSSVG